MRSFRNEAHSASKGLKTPFFDPKKEHFFGTPQKVSRKVANLPPRGGNFVAPFEGGSKNRHLFRPPQGGYTDIPYDHAGGVSRSAPNLVVLAFLYLPVIYILITTPTPFKFKIQTVP